MVNNTVADTKLDSRKISFHFPSLARRLQSRIPSDRHQLDGGTSDKQAHVFSPARSVRHFENRGSGTYHDQFSEQRPNALPRRWPPGF